MGREQPVPATTVTLVEGATFVIAVGDGDIDPGGVEGLFVGDTRICSALHLRDRRRDVVEPLSVGIALAVLGRVRRSDGRSDSLVFRDLSVGQGHARGPARPQPRPGATRGTSRLSAGGTTWRPVRGEEGFARAVSTPCRAEGGDAPVRR